MAKDALDLILGATQSAGSGGGGGGNVPTPTAEDAGKVLTVGDEQTLEWDDIPKELPTPASGDAGKVLTVNNAGTPGWADVPKELPSYNNLNSKMLLKVNLAGNGLEWGAKDDAAMLKASLDYSIYRNTGTIKVNGTSVTTRTNYFDLWYDGVFHGYRHLHKISAAGGISANSTLVFSNFKVPERCSELYVFTGSSSYAYVQRANIKNITPTSHSLSLSNTYAPADVYAYDFEIELSASLAKNDYIMTLFIPCGLDLASYTAAHGVPTHAAADAGKVPVVQNDGTLAWQTPSGGGGGGGNVPTPTAEDAGKALVVKSDGTLAWETVSASEMSVPYTKTKLQIMKVGSMEMTENMTLTGALSIKADGGIFFTATGTKNENAFAITEEEQYRLILSSCPFLPGGVMIKDADEGDLILQTIGSTVQRYMNGFGSRGGTAVLDFVAASSFTITAGMNLSVDMLM